MKRRIYKSITLQDSLEITAVLFAADKCVSFDEFYGADDFDNFNEEYEYEKMMDYKIWLRDCNCPAWAQ